MTTKQKFWLSFALLCLVAAYGSLGTGVVTNIPMASSGTALLTFNPPIGPFVSGISVGSATAIGGATPCGTAATGVTILYK